MSPVFPPGATPLDPDEAAGLIPTHITTQEQLNEWELANILEGERWVFSRKRKDLLSSRFFRVLHERMFGNTWRWAGTFRATEKNIGIDPAQIAPELKKLCDDVAHQIQHASYPLDETAARFHHRLTWIHPFPNGNGRLSRTIADLLLVQNDAPRFTWGLLRGSHECHKDRNQLKCFGIEIPYPSVSGYPGRLEQF